MGADEQLTEPEPTACEHGTEQRGTDGRLRCTWCGAELPERGTPDATLLGVP